MYHDWHMILRPQAILNSAGDPLARFSGFSGFT